MWNGHKHKEFKIDLRGFAGTKFVKYGDYLRDIIYMTDPLGNSGFFTETLVPVSGAVYCRVEKVNGVGSGRKDFVRVFWKKSLPREMKEALLKRCLVEAN